LRIERIHDARTVAIYALCEADTWEPRYIGKTVQYLHERHKAHISAAKAGRDLPVHRWIRKQLKDGKPLAIDLIEYVTPDGNWTEREQHWISVHRRNGRLLNLTKGGEGLPGLVFSQEHRQKIADALRSGETFGCRMCGTSFYRKQKDIKRGDNKFCSRKCYQTSLRGVSKPVSDMCKVAGIAAAAAKRKAQTTCKRGHPLSGANLFMTSNGGRGCKECRKLHKAAYRSRLNG
jgi:hypothetical protein